MPWWPQRCRGGGCGERDEGGTRQKFEFFGPQAAASPRNSLEKQILRPHTRIRLAGSEARG